MKIANVFIAFFLLSLPSQSQTTVSYTYDNLNRVTQAIYSTGTMIQYTYDALGNRTQDIRTVPSYAVSLSSNPTAGGNLSGAGTYQNGQTCSVSASTNAGYTFSNWTENGVVVSTVPNYSFTVFKNRTLVANYTTTGTSNYSITISANPTIGGSVSGGGTYTNGQTCTLAASQNPGYTFSNWTENGIVVSSAPTYIFTVSGNRTLVANYTTNGVSTSNIATSSMPTSGGTTSGGGIYTNGQTCNLIAAPAGGYIFSSWTESGNIVSIISNYSFIVNSARNLVANFTIQSPSTFSVATNAIPSIGGNINGGGTFTSGQSCTVSASPNFGYTFTHWVENGNIVSTNANYTFNVLSNTQLSAVFTLTTASASITCDQYLIVPSTPYYGQNASFSFTVSNNSAQTFNDTLSMYWRNATLGYKLGSSIPNLAPNTSHTFHHISTPIVSLPGLWYLQIEDALGSVKCSTLTSVILPPDSADIIVNNFPSNAGTVSGMGKYANGQICHLIATPNSGFSFMGWVENGVLLDMSPTYSFTVSGLRRIEAQFIAGGSPNNYTVTTNSFNNIGGKTIGDGSYNNMNLCSVSAIPDSGYMFLYWLENGNTFISDKRTYTFRVYGHRNLIAYFGPISFPDYYIRPLVAMYGAGTVSSGRTYKMDSICTVSAVANNGYVFVNWTENGNVVSSNINYTFQVKSHRTLYANFVKTILGTKTIHCGSPILSKQKVFQGDTLNVIYPVINYGSSDYNWSQIDLQMKHVKTDVLLNYSAFSNNIPAFNTDSIKASFHTTFDTGYHRIYIIDQSGGMPQLICDQIVYVKKVVPKYDIKTTSTHNNLQLLTGAGLYYEGDTCTLVARSDSNYYFREWTESGQTVSLDSIIKFSVNRDRNLEAVYSKIFKVNYLSIPFNGGTFQISINGFLPRNKFFNGDQITLTAKANLGFKFSHWNHNGNQYFDSTLIILVDTNKLFEAIFDTIQNSSKYIVFTSSNPSSGGITNGGGNYSLNDICNVSTTVNNGYQFLNWSENGSILTTNMNYTFTVDRNRNLTANFKAKGSSITNANLDIKIFPNPTTGKVVIEIPSLTYESYKVKNMLGQIVSYGRITKLSTEFDISNLAKGVYKITLISAEGTEKCEKILLE